MDGSPDVEFLNPLLRRLHELITQSRKDITELARRADLEHVFSYETSYARKRDPFPDEEAEFYMPSLRAHLLGTVPPPARILEVGAGTGRFTVRLAGLGYDVHVVEPAASGLALVAEKAKRAGVAQRISYFCGGFGDLPAIRCGPYDACIAMQSIFYRGDVAARLRECFRIAPAMVCFDVPSRYGFLLGGLVGTGISLEAVRHVLDHGWTPGREGAEQFLCATRQGVSELVQAAGGEICTVEPVLLTETMGAAKGLPLDERLQLDALLRSDAGLRDFGAFHLVFARSGDRVPGPRPV